MDTALTIEQARELLDAPSGSRPRIYGVIGGGDECSGQIVKIGSIEYLERFQYDRVWLSGTTVADLIRKA